MTEAVRLVIWDLDETFWKGTLTEGGIEICWENCSLVIDLARRGIVSSICSKNDHETVRKILEEIGIWQYFVLPSINWEPKGPRIRELIDAIQLRALTVMFIDDNPLNLHEAKSCVPGLQVSGENIIPDLLSNELFKGKEDGRLARLKQYRLLELRKRDADAASGNVEDFLRESQIRVEINYDVLSNLDRAIELITRTNQLNFTKAQLSSDLEEAKNELRSKLGEYHVHAGLIRVMDRYGDHGFCGIYLTQYLQKHLVHFCFSCRILGMGVEAWLYNKLGRPGLHVTGEVLTDVVGDRRSIDWINVDPESGTVSTSTKPLSRFGLVYARGGCDLEALMHYIGPSVEKRIGEYATSRAGLQTRRDHTIFLRYAIEGLTDEVVNTFCLLGYEPDDLKSAFRTLDYEQSLYLLSFINDPTIALYRHKATGILVPFQAPGLPSNLDVRYMSVDDVSEQARTPRTAAIFRVISEEFEYEGVISEDLFKENLRIILCSIPSNASVVLMLSSEDGFNGREVYAYDQGRELNVWMKQVASGYPRVSFLDMRSLVDDITGMDGQFHYDRMVYYRAFKELEKKFSSSCNAGPTGYVTNAWPTALEASLGA